MPRSVMPPAGVRGYCAQLDYNGKGAATWIVHGKTADACVEEMTRKNAHLLGVGFSVYENYGQAHPRFSRYVNVGRGVIGMGYKEGPNGPFLG